jgi:hypothetical protein
VWAEPAYRLMPRSLISVTKALGYKSLFLVLAGTTSFLLSSQKSVVRRSSVDSALGVSGGYTLGFSFSSGFTAYMKLVSILGYRDCEHACMEVLDPSNLLDMISIMR